MKVLAFSIYSNLLPKIKIFKIIPSQYFMLKSVISRTFSNTTMYKWAKTQQLLTLKEIDKIFSNIPFDLC